MPTLLEVGEVEAIRRLIAARVRAGAVREAGVVVDSGDDAAVVRPRDGFDLIATTDAFVEGVHYDPAWLGPRAIGARLAAANLSDLAAMAAEPRWALLSLGVRPDRELADLLELQTGLADALAREGASLVGGNMTAVEGREWWDLSLLGEAPRGRAWTRRGARPGDLLCVSGSPGRAGAGLAVARRLGERGHAEAWRSLIEAWLAPRPRCAVALALAPLAAVSAAIDLSDGFASDLTRLCEASGVGAEILEADWPADPTLARAAAELGVEETSLRYGPSDDYELALAVDPGRGDDCLAAARAVGVPLAMVGRFTDSPGGIAVRGADGATRALESSGFDHFSGPARKK